MVAADEGELVALADNTYGLSLVEPEDKDNEVYTTLSTNQSNPTIIKSIDDYSPTPAEDKTTIYYGFYITPDTPKGTYEGSVINYEAKENAATVVYDGNGKFYFDGDTSTTTNTMSYIPGEQSVPQYSHTPNVNDEGVQDGMYPLDSNETFVYEFPGYEKTYFEVIKTEGDYPWPNGDYFSIWSGSHPNYTALNDYDNADSVRNLNPEYGENGKYYFYSNYYNGSSVGINENSITIAYTSDSDRGCCGGTGYGYYAKVIGYNPNIVTSGEYEKPEPNGTYRFLGWSEDKDATTPTYKTAADIERTLSLTTGKTATLYAISEPGFVVSYNGNGADSTTNMDNVEQYTTNIETTSQVDLLASNFTKSGHGFAGWSTDQDAWTHLTDDDESNNPTIYGPNQMITVDPSASTKLNLYAVWAPAETDASGEPISLQDWQGCSALTPTTYNTETGQLTVGKNTITALTDSRDGNIYTVARLADGNCWMTENLRLDNNPELSQQNTNNPSLPLTNNYEEQTTSNFLSATSSDWCTDYDSAPCYNQSKLNTDNTALTTTSPVFAQDFTSQIHKDFEGNISSYSNYYNWYSATAGNGKQETGRGVTVAGDICPAGWMLPIGSKTSANGSFSHLDTSMGGTGSGQSTTEASNKWRSFPNNFVYSGGWYGLSAGNRGNNGLYWSSTAYGTYSAYHLSSYSGYVYPGTDNNKYNGYSVRCVAPVGTTITFDGNGNTGGEMSKQRIAQNTITPLDSNKFTKGDDVFASWNTERDGSGASYADGQGYTAGEGNNNVTLYAQWADCVPNKICYKSNGADSSTTMDPQSASSSTGVELWASNYKYDANNDGHNDYGFAGWSEDKDAATKLTDNNPDNNPVVYGPNQTITTGDLSLEGMKLYAVWIAPEQNTSFQDFSCPTNEDMPIGTVIALKDGRDNEVYTVAKLADGNCWMTENLRLDNNATINATNTNNPISTFTALSPSSNSWCTTSSASCYNQSLLNTNNITNPVSPMTGTNANTYSYSNYYNWYSATAGNGTYNISYDTVVSGDLCPTGWHLPYGGVGTGAKGGNTSGGFYYLDQQMGAATGAAGSNNWRSFPNNFVYSGYWNGSSGAYYRGRYGYYWSSTADSTIYVRGLSFGSGSVAPGTTNFPKYYGNSVRCVAPVQ